MTTTLYIVPGDGQCRIVSRPGKWAARYSYAFAPDEWKEVGLMDPDGRLMRLEAPKTVWDQMIVDSPLSAGLEVVYDDAGDVQRNTRPAV